MAVPKFRFPGFTGDWEQRKLEEWGTFYYGHSCPKWSVTADATTPCIRYGELYTKFGTKIDRAFSYTNMPTDKLRFSKGTEVLIPRVGEDPMDYNHCAWLSIPDVAIGEMISVFNTEQNPLFAATMFNATLQKEFAMRVEGGSVTNLYFEKLKNIEASFPKIEEQEKIARFFEEIDNLVTLHHCKYGELQDLKKSMLQKIFPKEGEKAPEIRFPGFTGDWEQRKLGELGEISTGSTPSTTNSAYYSDDGMPWVTPTDINALTISDTPRKLSEEGAKVGRVVPANTILCTCIASIGKNTLLTVKGSFNQQINSLTPYDENDAYFLLTESEIWSNTMKRMAASGTMQIVNKTEFFELKTKVPSLAEQQQIGTYFRNLDNLITLHRRKCDELKELKKGLLQQLFC